MANTNQETKQDKIADQNPIKNEKQGAALQKLNLYIDAQYKKLGVDDSNLI